FGPRAKERGTRRDQGPQDERDERSRTAPPPILEELGRRPPHQDGQRRQGGQDVAGQLRTSNREEHERKREPEEEQEVGARQLRSEPRERGHEEARPRKEAEDDHGHVIEEGPGVVVDGGREARHVVAEEEDVHELASLRAKDEQVPRSRHEQEY